MSEQLNDSDRERIRWSIEMLNDITSLGRDKPLGDLYPVSLLVVGALKKVLEPNIN